MGKLRDLWNKITGRDRIQALPGEGNEGVDRKERFRLEIQAAAQKNGINEISNGGDLITTILTYLRANSKIINHEVAKEELQTFVMGILEQNHLDTRYFAEEDIIEMIKAIKQSRVMEGTNIIPFNGREGVHYGIGIDDSESGNGSIEVTKYNQDVISEKYSYKLNESGNLCVKRDIYRREDLGDDQIYESTDVEYNKMGIEIKREEKEWKYRNWSRRKEKPDAHRIIKRNPEFSFVGRQTVLRKDGKNVQNPKEQDILLCLESLNCLRDFQQGTSGGYITFKNREEIKEYWRNDSKNGNRISLMLKAFNIPSRNFEGR